MRLNPASGLMDGVRYVPSPNCDDRPAGMVPEVLVIHAISLPPGEFGGPGIERLFCNGLDPAEHPYYRDIAHLEVSSHFLIRRSGEVIQYVPVHRRAWHAGKSHIEGRERVNDFSIGIELEGTDDQPFEDAQYEALAKLTCALMEAFPAITAERIYGHCDIAPGRKTDPGTRFDWARYRDGLSVTRFA
jgi:AmpD protein